MRKILSKLSRELGLSIETVENTYKAYWLFIREKIKNLPLKKNMTEEEFESLKTNFNLPSLGKLNCTYERWKRLHDSNCKYKKENDQYNEYYSDV